MAAISFVQETDREFWFSLDPHLPPGEFAGKVRDRRGYVLRANGVPAGLLRYHLFWDSIPFCSMLLICREFRGKGFGRELMAFWEADMRSLGYPMVMTSTRADEDAQHFYRRLGYRDSGVLLLDSTPCAQPAELFFTKTL
ncbi:MAG: GNAT family N-acetyltransferase [Oscillospiraceae bacterium]|nr:GNAT family N-acetyltransferase [Oscillospiraceae bacterium]